MYSLLRLLFLLSQPSFSFLRSHLSTESQMTVNELPTYNFLCLLTSLGRAQLNHFSLVFFSTPYLSLVEEEMEEQSLRCDDEFFYRECNQRKDLLLLIEQHISSEVIWF